jgi:hypothetical protein
MAATDVSDQPPPAPNDERPSWEAVIEDMQDRHRIGMERYGTPLQPGNGRDSIVDAYQEALDEVVYLRNAITERRRAREAVVRVIAELRAQDFEDWPTILETQVLPALGGGVDSGPWQRRSTTTRR